MKRHSSGHLDQHIQEKALAQLKELLTDYADVFIL